jgi:hypothetical protein
MKTHVRKGWKLVCLTCLTALMIFLIAGCASEPPIVGYWQSTEDASVHVEFTDAGNLIIDTGKNIANGTYELLSDNYVKVNINGPAGLLVSLSNKDTWKYEATKSELTLSAGSTSKSFKKVS